MEALLIEIFAVFLGNLVIEELGEISDSYIVVLLSLGVRKRFILQLSLALERLYTMMPPFQL